jgi:hypothetical protein
MSRYVTKKPETERTTPVTQTTTRWYENPEWRTAIRIPVPDAVETED